MRQLIFILLFFPLISFSQSKLEIANQHLKNLREGALLIRLYTSESKIEALRQAGRDKEAENVIREQRLENLAIYTSFNATYDFSPVYFFYNTSSDKVRQKEFQGIMLNENLEADSGIIVSEKNIYISEFDLTPGTGLYALVVKDAYFEFLEKPFPYYIKRFDLLPIFRRNQFEMIGILNNKLHEKFKKIN